MDRTTIAGLLLAVTGAAACGVRVARARFAFPQIGLPGLIAAAWLVLLPVWLSLASRAIATVPLDWLTVEAIRVSLLTIAGLCVCGLPAAGLGTIFESHRMRRAETSLLTGAACGVAMNALLLGPLIGLQIPLLAVSAATAVIWFVRLIRGTGTSPETVPPGTGRSPQLVEQLATLCLAVLVGLGCAAGSRMLAQLMLEAGYLIACGIATFLIGVSAGSALVRRSALRTGSDLLPRRFAGLLVVVALLLPLAVFPWLVDRHLDANAFVSSVFWLAAIRIVTVAAVMLPLGGACGLAAGTGRRREPFVATFVLGFVVAGWLLPPFGVVAIALTAGLGSVACSIGSTGFRLPQSRLGWTLTATCGVALAVIVPNAGRFDPAHAARLLFNTTAFLARQTGTPAELLPHLDDTRLVSSRAEPQGIVTVWRKRGETEIVRIDGMPIAAASRNPARCPQPSGDVARMALPLMLHQNPNAVLVLGDPLGTGTATAARFPVQQIVCYDTFELASRPATGAEDDRIVRSTLEPRLALLAQRQAFDVVVSDPGIPSSPAAAPYFSREFYLTAAETLTGDGIFCQRIRYTDYGAEPLRVIAATMQTVFGETMVIEIATGEYAVLGVRSGSSLVREGLVDRLKRPHARRLMATMGWDWCVPLNLTSVEHEQMKELAAEAGAINRDGNGVLACTLPLETMRWGAKWQELQQATTGKTTRLFVRAVPAEEREDVLARLSEVVGQHRLMTAFPDQPWAYRKEVRTQLTDKPRGVIRPVAGEVLRERHPVDRRRVAYFEALGKAIHDTTEETLAALERFREPYDPMLTYFLHHEIAPLYASLGEAGAAGEFAHRIYTAYYADPQDRSVRDVAATIELLADHPELVADDASRFDHFNGLVEVLLDRWEARGITEPRSPEVVMIDIDKSLDATETAIDAMTPLAAAAGLSEEDWRRRRAAIDRTFTRPLRKYRTSLLPHLRAAQKKMADAAEATDDAKR